MWQMLYQVKIIEGRLKRMGVVKLTVGLVLGVVAGAAVGTIVAPKAGKETRNLVKSKSTELVGTVRSKLHERQKTLVP